MPTWHCRLTASTRPVAQMDTEGKGWLDFIEFVMLTCGLEGYAFDRDSSSAGQYPQLVINAPLVVAADYEIVLASNSAALTEPCQASWPRFPPLYARSLIVAVFAG